MNPLTYFLAAILMSLLVSSGVVTAIKRPLERALNTSARAKATSASGVHSRR